MKSSKTSQSRSKIWLGFAPFFALLLAGCSASNSSEEFSYEDNPIIGNSFEEVRFSSNVRIGEIIWINDREDFAVVRMDAARPAFQPAFLLATDPLGAQRPGVLIGGGQVEGRSFGARIVEGPLPLGAEVRIPGPEWTKYLYDRYSRTERIPSPVEQ